MKKTIKTTILTSIGLLTAFFGTALLASCGSSSDKIYVANWESYINEDLKKEIENNNSVDYKQFGTNEEAQREFDNHHISIPSSYVAIDLITQGKVEPVDWPAISNGEIANAEEAKTYFTEDTMSYLNTPIDLNGNEIETDVEDNLLYWSVPYFAQDLVIGYKAETPVLDGKTIDAAFTYINQNLGKKGSGMEFEGAIMVNDARTMYSLAARASGADNVNPSKDDTDSTHFDGILKKISDTFGNGRTKFETDSNAILNDFASDSGSDLMVSYNGDFLYATYGGDSGILPTDPMQIYRPEGSIYQALELVIVNKDSYNESNEENIWEIIQKIAFDLPEENETWEDSWSYVNFDYVNYTPTIKSLWEYIMGDGEYFVDENGDVDELGKKALTINPLSSNLIDDVITPLQQSNLVNSWNKTRNEMA